MNRIYLDHASTTPIKKQVFDSMIPYLTEFYGNPSSLYKEGKDARNAIDLSRDKVAKAIGCRYDEVYFTASGTEADNMAIRGVINANKNQKKHIITSCIEHPAVMQTCLELQNNGVDVTYLHVDANGIVNPLDVEKAINQYTVLVSIMTANNEIGTIQPIAEIGAICKKNSVLFHTDAVQAIGHIEVDVVKMNIDMLSMSGHKFYGPKGIGVLYIRKGVEIKPIITGGSQEKGIRAATENVACIVGLGEAIEIATKNIKENSLYLQRLKEKARNRILDEIPLVKINGEQTKQLPGLINLSFKHVYGETLMLMLDMKGIATSSGSACSSGNNNPSYVLTSIGLNSKDAQSSLRISFGCENNEKEVDIFVDELKDIVEKLRKITVIT